MTPGRRRSRRRTAAPFRADLGDVHTGTGAALEDDAFVAEPVEDRAHLVLDGEDETRARLLRHAWDADVEPHRRVERGVLPHHQVLELVGKRVAVGLAGEVTRPETRARDGVDDAVDHLLDARLARGRAELAAEVLRGNHVRSRLRPELRHLD